MIFTLNELAPERNGSTTWDECLVYQNDFFTQYFADNTLVLTDWDFTSLTEATWPAFIEQVQQFVTNHNIKTILINSTLNPVDVGRKPTPEQMQRDLSTVVATYYITPDFAYWYAPKPGFIFFPFLLWIFVTKNIDRYFNNQTVWADPFAQPTVYDTYLQKTKPLMCLNRNLQWHRIYLFSLLAECAWFDQIDYSFMNRIPESVYSSFVVNKNLTAKDLELIRSKEHLLPIKLKSEADIENHLIPIQYMRGAGSVDSPAYASNAINLVTETSLTEGVILTEKTAKPFMAYQIPIILGPTGCNKFLQELGLDMFEDYIPWRTWDNELDYKRKIQKIVAFLNQLMIYPQGILDMHQRLHPRLIKNKEYFHSLALSNKLVDQLYSYGVSSSA